MAFYVRYTFTLALDLKNRSNASLLKLRMRIAPKKVYRYW